MIVTHALTVLSGLMLGAGIYIRDTQMGYNTVAFFLNDQSSEIERDPLTIRRLKDAMACGMGNDDRQYMTVLPSVHADGQQVIMAGGNRVTSLAVLFGCDHTEEALLRGLAERLGYSLRKKKGCGHASQS